MNNKDTINQLTNALNRLLCSNSIEYKNWEPNEYSKELKGHIGIYHFFRKRNNTIESLYVGKAGVGNKEDWDLYERLKQHFQTSQKNTLLGKYAKSFSISAEETKVQLNGSGVQLQWLKVTTKSDDERTLMRLECFCKAVLNPKFTDQ